MKISLKDGVVEYDLSVLKENFGFFELFDDLIVADDSLDMSHLPITVNAMIQLISLGKTRELCDEKVSNHKELQTLLFNASIDNVLYKSLIDASMCLDTHQSITMLLEHEHMYNRLSMYKECSEFYKATMLEVDIRSKIAKGKTAPFYGVVEITRDVCNKTIYTPLDPSCKLLFLDFNSRTRTHNIGDRVMQYRELKCEIVKKILSLGNVVISGGYALKHVASHEPSASDIDIFVWGVTEQQATVKLQQIGSIVGGHPYFTGNACTFVDNNFEDNLSVQVILRLYGTPSEIVHGFDIQASKVLMTMDNGVIKCYGTPSFITTMQYNAVWIDTERQSSTYALRMIKYFCKGFSVVLTGYNEESACETFMSSIKAKDIRSNEANMSSQKGLSLLLHMERYMDSFACFPYHCNRVSLLEDIKTMCHNCNIANKSDYMESMCSRHNLRDFLRTAWRCCSLKKVVESLGWRWVKSASEIPPVKWTIRDPGSQTIIGSFHPEQENYYKEVYGFKSNTGLLDIVA
jgi:hypothetical protein